MLASRGLRIFRTGRCNLGPDIKRQFSSTIINSKTRTPSILSNASKTHLRPRISRISAPLILNGILNARFASTQPPPTPASTPIPPTTPETTPTPEIDITDITSAFDFDPTQITAQIGYLKSLGIDHGWGPTSVMQWILEHIHMYTGGPWPLSIALTALAIRILFLRLSIDAGNNAARMATIKPISEPLTKRMQEALKEGDQGTVMRCRKQLSELNKKAGVNMWKSFAPMIQFPLGYGVFRLFREMAELPVPGWENGGFAWFTDLTVADPTYIMPLISAASLYVVMLKGGENGQNATPSANPIISPQMLKYASYGVPFISFIFISGFPASLQLYFLVTGLCSLGQTYAFNSPYFRNILGMDPLPPKAPQEIKGKEDNAMKVLPRQVNEKILTLADVRRRREMQRIRYEKPREEMRREEGVLGDLRRKIGTFRKGLKSTRQSIWPTGLGEEEEEKRRRENSGARRRK